MFKAFFFGGVLIISVQVHYYRHCDDIGHSVIPPFMRTRKKMIAYPSMPLKQGVST